MSSSQPNNDPYAPIESHLIGAVTEAPASDVERIRNEHLSHEASVKSIGLLYYLGAFFGGLAGLAYTAMGIYGATAGGNAPLALAAVLAALGVAVLAISVFQFFVGRGIRKLAPWSRIAAVVFSCIGLLAIPLGTLISIYCLYLLLSKKGEYIFSPGYQNVIAATPHLKYKTSIVVVVLFVILVALLTIGILAVLLSGVS